jgi:hypothetical protein
VPVINVLNTAGTGTSGTLTITTSANVAATGEYAVAVQCATSGASGANTWGVPGSWTNSFTDGVTAFSHWVDAVQASPASGAALSYAPTHTITSTAEAGVIAVFAPGAIPTSRILSAGTVPGLGLQISAAGASAWPRVPVLHSALKALPPTAITATAILAQASAAVPSAAVSTGAGTALNYLVPSDRLPAQAYLPYQKPVSALIIPPSSQAAVNAGLAHGTGTAQSPVVQAQSATDFILTAGKPSSPNSLTVQAGASIAPAGSPPSHLTIVQAIVVTNANAGLAHATGTAQQPLAAVAANAGLAHASAGVQPAGITAQSATDFILNAREATPNSTIDQTGASQATPMSPQSRLVTAQPIVVTNAGLAHATGTAQSPLAGVGASAVLAHATGTALQPQSAAQSAADLILTAGKPPVPNSAGAQTGASQATPLSPQSRLVTAQAIGVTNAGLAHGAGTAQQPRAAIAANASLAHATGTAQALTAAIY